MPFLRGSDSPVGVNPKRASIQFAETLVTGVSRPVTIDEQWTLYRFEHHACKCKSCRKPFHVQQEGRQLCPTGRDLAVEVAHLLFRLRSDGSVYCKSRSEHQEIRIEIPPDYRNVIGLLKAVKAGGKGFLKAPKSYDRTYEVRPRVPSRQHSSKQQQQQQPQYSLEWHGYATETVRPSSSHRQHKKSRHAPERTSRGSLWEDDMRAQEEQYYRESLLPLNLEVQRPYRPMYSYR